MQHESMTRFLPALCSVLCLFTGLSLGWYMGYTRPLARHERTTQEANMKLGSDTERSDELAAAVSLGVFQCLEKGDRDQADHKLLGAIGSYYRVYHTRGGDTNILTQIETAAQKYPSIAAELSGKVE